MPGVRIDSGVVEGGEIGVHYDPLISNLIANGASREAARRRAVEALRHYPILGIRTNVAFLIELLEHPRFVAGAIDTWFLDNEGAAIRARSAPPPSPEAVDIAQAVAAGAPIQLDPASGAAGAATSDPWVTLGSFRG
jgi:acetyl/propionyl-CoA carboxylase alpha subunit